MMNSYEISIRYNIIHNWSIMDHLKRSDHIRICHIYIYIYIYIYILGEVLLLLYENTYIFIYMIKMKVISMQFDFEDMHKNESD
jgi:hypothetical protein